ncbi:phage tail sheath subtilisin-like domain-containing protein [Denitratisoma sp. agr-D3]
MPDNITYLTIPTDWRVPGQYLEIDPSRAVRGLPTMPHKILYLGQRLASGSKAAGVLTRVTRSTDGVDYFGRGSMLAQMVTAGLKVNPYTESYALALDDLTAGVQATGTINITGTSTTATTLYVYIGGIRLPVGVGVGDSATAIGNAIVTVVNNAADLAVSAAANNGVVTLTAKHKGAEGNTIDVRIGYYGSDPVAIAGTTLAVTAMHGGSGNPDVLDAIAAMSSGQYYTIVMGWTDAANLMALENELKSRFGGMDMRTGHAFAWPSGNLSAQAALGDSRNSPHSTLINGVGQRVPTLPWVAASQAAAGIEFSGANDPAEPFRGIFLPDVLPPAEVDRFQATERNLLLHNGISTCYVGDDGGVYVEQVITTYQSDSFGLDDVSLLKLNTKWTVDYMRYTFRTGIARNFPKHKLAGDDVLLKIQPGQRIATPKLITNVLLGEGRKLLTAGLLEDYDQFKADLKVVRSLADVNRVNAILSPNVVNQFDVFAASIQYVL